MVNYYFLSIINVSLHHSFIAIGLKITSGINGSLIMGVNPLLTAILSFIILRERISWYRIFGFMLGFFGIIITTMSGINRITDFSLGDLYVFIGVFVQGLSFVLISLIKPTFDIRLVTGYMLVVGALFIFIISQTLGVELKEITSLISWKLGSIFFFSVLIATAFGQMAYNYSITQVGPTKSAIFLNLNMLFPVIGSAVFLNDLITFHHIIGFFLILSGVFLGTGTLDNVVFKK